jgi:hypothetical protein
MIVSLAACSAERTVSPAAQPQKSALLQCRSAAGLWDAPCGPKPLLLIDGKRSSWDGSTDLNPSEIESVEVFRGEKAMSLYGEAARHGVVQITLRKSHLKL